MPRLVLSALLVGGCAAPLAVQQTGRVVPRGDLRLGAGAGMGLSTSALEIVDAARDAADDFDAALETCTRDDGTSVTCVAAAQYDPFLRSALVGVLFTPIVPYFAVEGRLGLGRPGLGPLVLGQGADVGIRYTGATTRLDANVQLFGPLDGSPGASATLGVAWNHHSIPLSSMVEGVFEKLHLEAFSRDDIDVPLVASYQVGEWLRLSAGVRYMASHWAIDLRPELPVWVRMGAAAAGEDLDEEAEQVERVILDQIPETDESGWFHHLGGLVSVWVGYEVVWIGAELTVTRYGYEATILGTPYDMSGWVLFPSVSGHLQF